MKAKKKQVSTVVKSDKKPKAQNSPKKAIKRGANWKVNLIKAKKNMSGAPSKLRSLRVKKGLSQSDLINPKKSCCILTISRIERRISPVNKNEADYIAKRLKTNVGNIFKKTDDKRYFAK